MTHAISSAPSMVPRVVIVDDDRRVQQSLADLLSLTERVHVIGGARDVRSALALVRRELPDVVIVDPRLPDVDAGEALVSTLEHSWPSMRIVLAGWSVAPEQPQLLSGACSYVSKSYSPEDFVSAIVNACGLAA